MTDASAPGKMSARHPKRVEWGKPLRSFSFPAAPSDGARSRGCVLRHLRKAPAALNPSIRECHVATLPPCFMVWPRWREMKTWMRGDGRRGGG
jgi:hypothetical protein